MCYAVLALPYLAIGTLTWSWDFPEYPGIFQNEGLSGAGCSQAINCTM